MIRGISLCLQEQLDAHHVLQGNEAVPKTPPDRTWVIQSLHIMTLLSQPVHQGPVIKKKSYMMEVWGS